jgi:hypothetical protein
MEEADGNEGIDAEKQPEGADDNESPSVPQDGNNSAPVRLKAIKTPRCESGA